MKGFGKLRPFDVFEKLERRHPCLRFAGIPPAKGDLAFCTRARIFFRYRIGFEGFASATR
jgi:hypothetical protein